MSDKELLERAIDRLEELTERGDGKYEWALGPDDDGALSIVGDPGDMNLGLFSPHRDGITPTGKVEWEFTVNSHLVVALHAAIPAMLAILKEGLAQANLQERSLHWHAPAAKESVALARAILGEFE